MHRRLRPRPRNWHADGPRTPFADRIVVVLNRTQDVVNIATSLRAMMNMGLTRCVSSAPDDFNAYRIAGIAHGSEPLIEPSSSSTRSRTPSPTQPRRRHDGAARRPPTCGTTRGRPRRNCCATPPTPHTPSPSCSAARTPACSTRSSIAATACSSCPPAPLNSSLNLSQAVLLIGYELPSPPSPRPPDRCHRPKRDAAPSTALERQALFEQIDAALHAIDFYKGKNPEAIMRTVRAMASAAPT
jgi:hypothetical protein